MRKRPASKESKANPQVGIIDLFCGAGGLTHGLERAGLNVLCGIDLDEACRVPFEANNAARFHAADVSKLSADWLLEQFGNVRHKVLVGCAPCQPFSPLNRSERVKG
ncbi:MAG: DNA cytosine methyltransferase, partial [Planctomycetota bacterium]